MKKNLLFICLISLLVTACSSKNDYTVTGKLPNKNYDGKTVLLLKMDSTLTKTQIIDSTKILNGQFSFKGTMKDSIEIRLIKLANVSYVVKKKNQLTNVNPSLFVLQAGKIELDMDTMLIAQVKGTALNNDYQLYRDTQKNLEHEARSKNAAFMALKANGTATSAQESAYTKTEDSLWSSNQKITYNIIKSNIKNPLGEYLFINKSFMLNENQLGEILSLTGKDFRQRKEVQRLDARLKARQATAVGKKYTDLVSFDTKDKKIALSQYVGKGKIVMVDFWASWCGPCVKIMPTVKNTYELYKKKGFEIIGVSLDEDKDRWTQKIKDLDMTWPQMSDLKAWKSEAVTIYGIDAIPHSILIDKDGTIVAEDLFGDPLNKKLDELLKK